MPTKGIWGSSVSMGCLFQGTGLFERMTDSLSKFDCSKYFEVKRSGLFIFRNWPDLLIPETDIDKE